MEFLELFINEIVNSACHYGCLNAGLLLNVNMMICVLTFQFNFVRVFNVFYDFSIAFFSYF